MDSIANLRERVEVVEQQINVMGAPISLVNQRPGGWRLSWRVAAMVALGLALAFPHGVQAKTFRCGAGDVPCLIAAINEANANGEANTIRLAAGTYTLTVADSSAPSVGLPVITSPLTITGRGADTTIIERGASAPSFGFLRVAADGTLTLKRLTLHGGDVLGVGSGSIGISNSGTLALVRTTVTANLGGGISNSGTLALLHSAVTANRGGLALLAGGISTSGGTVTIAHSTIAGNRGTSFGGLVIIGGTVTLHATTVTRNFAQGTGGIHNGGLTSGGTVIITKSAITQNLSDNSDGAAGISTGARWSSPTRRSRRTVIAPVLVVVVLAAS